MMFEEGALLYFRPFIFPDGGEPKSKFFVVLKNLDGDLLLVSLPTSKDHIPADIALKQGCVELPDRMVNAYVFLAGNSVTDSFSFDVNTFIYGAALKTYPSDVFDAQVANGEIVVEYIGHIVSDLFEELKECLKNSSAVKRRYKKLL